ncbi:hypothetical protein BDW02DRAFT_583970 [Decorospora gaudefroyi]|uniref:Aminoglycoside phosphotransferase domain-containing protein n=1 Tax=Decorospora gaudefroyi TaxID=184978 RepID=A0A6A5JWR7_9PLEO|nr:hypothetical protein BDW02DRAFT_583970 [Decorospora gaudefroyi]
MEIKAPTSRFNPTDLREFLDKKAQEAEQDHDDGDTDDYTAATTSTVLHEQEPFETFKSRVALLCFHEFGNATVIIERMRGGTYNRITAITVTPLPPRPLSVPWLCSFLRTHESQTKQLHPKYYILRALRRCRSNDWGLAYDAPTLEFACSIFGSVVPRLVRINPHSDNVLLRPYTIQERLPGQNLSCIWKSLTMAQKECALRIIVRLTRKLQTVQGSAAGVIARTDPSKHFNTMNTPQIHTFNPGDRYTPRSIGPSTGPAVPQTTLQFMQHQAQRWSKQEEHDGLPTQQKWRQFITITQSLHDTGYLPNDDKFYFCHLDLYPRNLLVDVIDTATLKLTGVLDWDADFAHFCPKFVAFRAPFWLWLDKDADESDERLATVEPADPDLLRLKRLWEECAGAEWMRYAFAPEYVIARRMFVRLRDGMGRVGNWEDVVSIVRDWQALRFDERFGTVGMFGNDGDGCASVESGGKKVPALREMLVEIAHTNQRSRRLPSEHVYNVEHIHAPSSLLRIQRLSDKSCTICNTVHNSYTYPTYTLTLP